MQLPAGLANIAALLGAVLHLGLISIIAFRMGYRWRWLPVPWVITVLFSVFHQMIVYNEAAKAGVLLNKVDVLSASVSGCAAYGLLVALVVLAFGGRREAPSQSVRLANA
jgi:hypothetical protein